MFNRKETLVLIKLGIPLILSGLVQQLVPFMATYFLGHLNTHVLAAGALVTSFFASLMVVIWGIFSAVTVLVARYRGAQQLEKIPQVLRDGFYLAIVLTLPVSFLIWHMGTLLHILGQNPALIHLATPYLHASAFGILPDLVGLLLLQFVVGLEDVRVNLWFNVSWVVLNIVLDYGFVLGHFGLPQLGIAGLGWGNTCAYWISTLLWIVYLVWSPRYRLLIQAMWNQWQPQHLIELVKVGLPSGLMFAVEVSFFFVLALQMGRINVNFLAANEVVIQYTGLLITVLFALAQAITVRVGYHLGSKAFGTADKTVKSGMLIALVFMAVLTAIVHINPRFWISLDLNALNPDYALLLQYGGAFLKLALICLMIESCRISLFGALRAYKATPITLISSLISFWCIAFPMGQLLAYHTQIGANGLWYGLINGALFGSIFLWINYIYCYKKSLQHRHQPFWQTLTS